ncbi:MAG: zinc ribbon domain-containing protein, partial [Thermodesulfobacteriota bacterium]|nr:zinc ribbon domain-containing protein [Thermodesulfobacteriota bacterium]
MNCPECRYENRVGAKFCKKCGKKLELVCPQCGNKVEPDSVFCDECGNSLSSPSAQPPQDLSFDEKLEKIQKYLPNGLTDKILA